MISGIDLNAVIDYVLPGDEDNPTVWKLGAIPSKLLGQLSAEVLKSGEIEIAFKLLQVGLRGWSNLLNVEYKTVSEKWYGNDIDIIPLELINQLPINVVTVLSTKILEVNGLTAEERKN